jgi:alpha-galactosidase
MSGRPKTQRTREPNEQPKATKMSRVGTVIICHKCKGVGHNKSSCDRRSANVPSAGVASAHSPGPASASTLMPTSGTQQSSIDSKRKLSKVIANQNPIGTTSSIKKVI